MVRMLSITFAAATALLAAPARAEDDAPSGEPPTGLSWIVGGSVALGVGAVNLVGAPLCMATLPDAQRVPCAGTSVAFGLAGLGVGIPLLVLGVQRRAAWQTWYSEHVTVAPERAGASFAWRATW